MVIPSSFAFKFFNLFFSVCGFSPLLFVTGFFFIKADLENDGLVKIVGNVITKSFHSYLDILCFGVRIGLTRSLCPNLVRGSFN